LKNSTRAQAKINGKSKKRKELLQEAKQQALAAKSTIADKASKTAGEAKDHAYDQVENQRQAVVEEIYGVNTALRKTAEQLNNESLERSLHSLANQVERTAEQLDQAELEEVVEAVEDFSRAQPLLFITGSFALGLLAGRFLNASTPSTHSATVGSTSRQPRPESEIRNEQLIAR
jgi:DNA-binding MurR/RpiR family transcriptional regulator